MGSSAIPSPHSLRPVRPRRTRQRLLCVGATVLLIAGLCVNFNSVAQARGKRQAGQVSTTKRQTDAIKAGVKWLAKNQSPGGKWGDEKNTRVADTSFALLALMANGNLVTAGRPLEFGTAGERGASVPELRGPYAAQVKKGVEYLARLAWDDRGGTKPRGYISDDKESRMHGHGFATLALATAAGNLGGNKTRDIKAWLAGGSGRDPSGLPLADQVRWALKLAIDCIEASQDRDTGGWLYEPYEQGHEGSMTVTQIAALRAARDAGMEVSDAVLARAYEYVRTSQNLTRGDKHGGFAYTKTNKGRVSYALTSAALTTLYGLGRYGLKKNDAKLIENGFRYMDRHTKKAVSAQQWFYYGLFYGAQALYVSQDHRRLARDWPKIRNAILAKHNHTDGSFNPLQHDLRSRPYCTAIAVLTLQVPLETLPIFQRR